MNDRIKNQLGYEWCDESTSKKIDAIIALVTNVTTTTGASA